MSNASAIQRDCMKIKGDNVCNIFYNTLVNTHLANISPCGLYETICPKIMKLYIVKMTITIIQICLQLLIDDNQINVSSILYKQTITK